MTVSFPVIAKPEARSNSQTDMGDPATIASKNNGSSFIPREEMPSIAIPLWSLLSPIKIMFEIYFLYFYTTLSQLKLAQSHVPFAALQVYKQAPPFLNEMSGCLAWQLIIIVKDFQWLSHTFGTEETRPKLSETL